MLVCFWGKALFTSKANGIFVIISHSLFLEAFHGYLCYFNIFMVFFQASICNSIYHFQSVKIIEISDFRSKMTIFSYRYTKGFLTRLSHMSSLNLCFKTLLILVLKSSVDLFLKKRSLLYRQFRKRT